MVASPGYLEQEGAPKRIEDLVHHRLLQFHERSRENGWQLVSPTGEMRVVRTSGRLAANSDLCLRENALNGLGLAFLPDFLVREDLATGRLRNAMPSLPQQHLPLFAVCPPGRVVLPRVRAFIDFMSAQATGKVKQRAIA